MDMNVKYLPIDYFSLFEYHKLVKLRFLFVIFQELNDIPYQLSSNLFQTGR